MTTSPTFTPPPSLYRREQRYPELGTNRPTPPCPFRPPRFLLRNELTELRVCAKTGRWEVGYGDRPTYPWLYLGLLCRWYSLGEIRTFPKPLNSRRVKGQFRSINATFKRCKTVPSLLVSSLTKPELRFRQG